MAGPRQLPQLAECLARSEHLGGLRMNKQMKVSLSLFVLLLPHWAWLGDLTQVNSFWRRPVRESFLPKYLAVGVCKPILLGWLGLREKEGVVQPWMTGLKTTKSCRGDLPKCAKGLFVPLPSPVPLHLT